MTAQSVSCVDKGLCQGCLPKFLTHVLYWSLLQVLSYVFFLQFLARPTRVSDAFSSMGFLCRQIVYRQTHREAQRSPFLIDKPAMIMVDFLRPDVENPPSLLNGRFSNDWMWRPSHHVALGWHIRNHHGSLAPGLSPFPKPRPPGGQGDRSRNHELNVVIYYKHSYL